MFSDEEPFTFKKMHDYSPVDGFVDVTESMADMIKFVANEPSLGLFYIQQHAQNAGPNIINLRKGITDKSREVSVHTEDSEDSITMVRSLKECGFQIADEMIRDIRDTLAAISSKQPKRGLIASSSWSPSMWSRNTGSGQEEDSRGSVSSSNIFSVFGYARLKPESFKEPIEVKGNRVVPDSSLPASSATSFDTRLDLEDDKIPLPSQSANLPQDGLPLRRSLSHQELLSLSEHFEDFKADREAKLEEWLVGTDNESKD